MSYHREPFEKPSDPLGLAIKIGIAVFIAITAAAAVRYAYAYWLINEVGHQAQQSIERMNAQNQARIEAIKERQRQEQQAKLQQQLIENERRRAEQAAQLEWEQRQSEIAAAKEEAWKTYYMPRKECEESNSARDFVECGNEYRRAKVKFEKSWGEKLATQ